MIIHSEKAAAELAATGAVVTTGVVTTGDTTTVGVTAETGTGEMAVAMGVGRMAGLLGVSRSGYYAWATRHVGPTGPRSATAGRTRSRTWSGAGSDQGALNIVWTSDIAYLETGEGWLSLAGVRDGCLRRVSATGSPTVCTPMWWRPRHVAR